MTILTTDILELPYPGANTTPDGRAQIQALAEALEELLAPVWHTVGDPGEPALLNSWTPGADEPRFVKIAGIVYITGRADHSGASTDNIFQLPDGFKPGGAGAFLTGSTGSAAAAFGVTPGGFVQPTAALTTIYFGGSFVAES
jgi:hypothetical protein